MIKKISAAIFVLVTLNNYAIAGPSTDRLSTCLVLSTGDTDKLKLANWVFRVMSEHPHIKNNIGNVYSPNQKTLADVQIAELFMRLLSEDCINESREAIRYENDAWATAFETLGEQAFSVLMTDAEVTISLETFIQYVDMERLGRVLTE